MRCADRAAAISILVKIVVAAGTRLKRGGARAEVCAFVFGMTGNASNAGVNMGLDHVRSEPSSDMT